MKIRMGRPELAFAATLAAYLVADYFEIPGSGFLYLAVVILAFFVAVRIARVTTKDILWRLRNRLAVAYFFIAVVPIVLITTLAIVGATLMAGQISLYLLTSEFDRRTAALRGSLEFIARNPTPQALGGIGGYLRNRYPGVEVAVEAKDELRRWPESSTLAPPATMPEGHGLILRDNLLYAWARVTGREGTVTALMPVTHDYLGELAPDIGVSTVTTRFDGGGPKPVLHDIDNPSAPPSHNRLPPPVNRFDAQFPWFTELYVVSWEKPTEVKSGVLLSITTRLSAVSRVVLAQRVNVSDDILSIVFTSIAVIFVLAEIVALLIGISLTRTITGTVHNIYEGTLHISGGDFSHRIPARGRDQLTELAVSFNDMASNMERLLAGEKERERLQAELEIAREVQNQLYPKKLPQVPSLRLTAACDPARMVSGDYYDYQQLEGNRVAIAIGDVAGKGISAALLMATIQSSFRTQVRRSLEMAAAATGGPGVSVISTAPLVTQLNQQLFADTAPEKYATFLHAVYEESTSTLTYTNAGHLPPILVRKGAVSRLDVNGMVVGAFPFARYDESHLKLESGDLLVFFTDGISEPENAYGEMFGEERLEEMVARNAHLPEQEIIKMVSEAVLQWTGSSELQDDMTLMLLRRV